MSATELVVKINQSAWGIVRNVAAERHAGALRLHVKAGLLFEHADFVCETGQQTISLSDRDRESPDDDDNPLAA
eukprot:SAG31_NODE_41358_length_276_cov_0.881356_1_plen_73_part_10